jgi:proline iminopeptidase
MDRRQFAAARALTFAYLMVTALASAAPGEGTFEGPGGKLYYEVKGTVLGRPLVVVNGGPGLDHSYLLLLPGAWDGLARSRRVIFYDQRGTGRSFALKAGAPDTVEEQIADLEALRAHLGLETMDLLGHSFGGYLAIAYAARHADRVAHLVLVDSVALKSSEDPSLFGQVFPDTVQRQEAQGFAAAFGDKDAAAESRRLRATMLFYSPENRDAYLKLSNILSFNQQVSTALGGDTERFDLNPEIRKFHMPVMVMTGRFDMSVAPVTAYKIHQAISGSRFVVFERSGHLPFIEEPDAFVRTLEDFLGK